MDRIFVVDDEAALRETLGYALEKEGFEVSVFPHGEAAWEAYQIEPPRLLLLDILMPRMDGLELCRLIRQSDRRTPIIFLSSRDEELDRVLGLEIGGDDYVGKPFSIRELTARIKAVLRRADGNGHPSDPPVSCGSLRLEPSTHRAFWNDREMVFTLSEFGILLDLVRHAGAARSRLQLYTAVFPDDLYANERAVDSHIKRIRRKLEEVEAPPDALATVYGLGYRLGLEA